VPRFLGHVNPDDPAHQRVQRGALAQQRALRLVDRHLTREHVHDEQLREHAT